MTDSTESPTLAGAVVRDLLYCRRCGYSLRGLPAEGNCPECGTAIWQSVIHTVDPAASRLPKLRNPRRVGSALFWLTLSIFLAGVLYAAESVQFELIGTGNGHWYTPPWLPEGQLRIASGVLGLLGLIAVARLIRPQAEAPARIIQMNLSWLAIGLAVWSLVILVRGFIEVTGLIVTPVTIPWLVLIGDIAAIFGLWGMRGIFIAVGLRSREYRTSRSSRQGAKSMMAAVCGDALGRIFQIGLLRGCADDRYLPISEIIIAVSSLMLLIGFAYLVMNSWWIRRSLRKPPPQLDEILQYPQQDK